MRWLSLTLLLVFLVGCTSPPPARETLAPQTTPTSSVTPAPTDDLLEPTPEGPVILRVWVPPQFDPANGSPEGELLQSRLDEFVARKPDVRVEVRVKNVDGPGGILDTLTTASAAAPLALPDLVALPGHALATAAGKGLLHPYDGLTTTLDDPDWYGFARQLSHLQNATFGIPFAGDALLMAYRPAAIAAPPSSWPDFLAITTTLAFPAADPQALFTLLQYQALGGPLLDAAGHPTLDVIRLTGVLSYYQQASARALMPAWLAQFENDDQSWEAYEQAQADIAITWAGRALQQLPADTAVAPAPTFDGAPFTLADGWAWALTSHNPDHQLLATQLAEFLTTSEYLAAWSEAAGLIPPRPSALAAWQNASLRALLSQIAPTAELIPSPDLVAALGPVLQQSVLSVLKAEADAAAAAQTAVEKLVTP